jgi:hypothetical protein
MKFAVERLENRVLLAASIKGKNLVVDGTDGADDIVLQGTGTPGEVEVSFDGGTTFSAPFSGFKNIKINLFGGDDDLNLNNGLANALPITITGNLTIKAGDGDDAVEFAGSYGGNVKIDLGAGDDFAQEDAVFDNNLIVGKNFSIKGGDGNDDYVPFQVITVGGNVKVDMGDGDDEVDLDVLGDFTINGRRISVKMGDGDDFLQIADTAAPNARVTLDGGAGDDDFDDDGGNTFGKTPKLKNFETVT